MVNTAEASTAASGEAGVAAENAAVLREGEAAKKNLERPVSVSNATGDEAAATKV
jgi:hypothetical protein